MSILLAPSILSADFGNLNRDIEIVNRGDADSFHLDVMDGVFVPNISYGFPIIKSIARKAEKPMDAHLMIIDPDRYLSNFKDLGVKFLSVHYEACTHLHRTVQAIRSLEMKAGVALNPHTPVLLLEDIVRDLDFVLVMSVNPGFGGQFPRKNSAAQRIDPEEKPELSDRSGRRRKCRKCRRIGPGRRGYSGSRKCRIRSAGSARSHAGDQIGRL